ncbi:MAG: hypothetical protein RMI90_05000, partial [Thermoguttaceae bacterium]|nr:hypothetical protein [Thermoguttaceae bacterium]
RAKRGSGETARQLAISDQAAVGSGTGVGSGPGASKKGISGGDCAGRGVGPPAVYLPSSEGGLVVGRLRKDAALCDLPAPRRRGQRGRPRLYGTKRISLWKRAAHPKGWERVLCVLYGQEQIKTIKTFLATYRVAGGLIRVLLVQEQDGVQAYFSTNPDWTPEQILEAVADRGSIKQLFRDVKQTWKADEPRLPVDHPIPLPKRLKEVWKTDRPQLRNVWSNLATWHRRAVGQSSVNFGSPNPQRNVCLPLQWPASLHGAIPVVQPALAETDGWAA